MGHDGAVAHPGREGGDIDEQAVAAAAPRRSWVRWVVLGCSAVVLAALGLAAAIAWIVFSAMKRSEAAQMALARARAHPAVVQALGEPIEVGWFPGGSISVNGPSGEAELSLPLEGPRGEGTLYLEAEKRAGLWTLELLALEPEDGERIDLLGSGVAP